jgi:hypothetical protein
VIKNQEGAVEFTRMDGFLEIAHDYFIANVSV